MQPPAVSVTVPAYNVGRFLRQSLTSVLAQDFDGFEVIVLDDGSGDDTWEVARRLSGDPRVRLCRWRRNRGIPAARNRLLELCRGRYLVAHDADDVMLPGRLRWQARFLDRHPEIGVVFGRLRLLDRLGHRFPPGVFSPRMETASGWTAVSQTGRIPDCRNIFFHHSTAMFRTDLVRRVGGYDQRWGVGEDTDLIRRLLPATRLYFVGRACFRYRLRGGSSTHRMRSERVSAAARTGGLPHRLRLSIGGVVCLVESDGPEVPEVLRKRLPLAQAAADRTRARLRLTVLTRMPRRGWMHAGLAPARVHSLMADGIAREPDPRGGGATVWMDPTRRLRPEALWQQAFLDPLSLAVGVRQRLLLDAGLVSRGPDDGILIVGPGSQRSAVTLALVERGYRYHGDGPIVLQVTPARVHGFQLATELALFPPAAIHFPGLRHRLRYHQETGRFLFDVARAFPDRLGLRCRVRTMLFPTVGPGRLRTARMGAARAMRRLLHDRYTRMRNAEPHRPGYRRHLSLQMRLAASLRAFAVRYAPEHIEDLPDRLARILD